MSYNLEASGTPSREGHIGHDSPEGPLWGFRPENLQVDVMETEEEPVVWRAVSILGDLNLPPEAVGRLAAMLPTPDAFRLEGAILLLEKLGPKGAPAIPNALALMKSQLRPTRLQALRFLGRTGSTDVASALSEYLKDSDPNTRADVLRTLGDLGAAGLPAKHAIRELLKDQVPTIRSSAEEILMKLEGAK
jgi:HEAT repeat protein